ncbi:alpha-L-rhamnosidase C-terminal domain-containing protein [Lewinella sp. IMCC34191]|uniref:alpha-L-rhamnosidase-related protein n=1 Tax=Lewinella sp. IMCC34191 TaxID=2259172 RepID=UPI000E28474F|nr:alpha-L-rhamnosidase C-terminal domain-containing protein [Lewinella sp. IMCC34191]
MKSLLVALLICSMTIGVLSAQEGNSGTYGARYVWTDTDTSEIFQVAYFRLSVTVEEDPRSADLHLFADSRYVLMVNGNPINFGPARFYPEHPSFDSYDLRPYLRRGNNVIGVKVLSNGAATFQLRRHRPGFIVWGEIVGDSGKKTDLTTTGENWYAHRAEGYLPETPKATFALGPVEIHDARKEMAYGDWATTSTTPDGWEHPVPIPSEDWGALTARPIPPLTQEYFRPWKILGRATFDTSRTLYAGQVVAPDQSWDGYRTSANVSGFTYVYSPAQRTATLLASPGTYRINGEEAAVTYPPAGIQEQQRTLSLRLAKGWNRLEADLGHAFGTVPIQFLIADSLGIQLSPDKKLGDDAFFAVRPPETDPPVDSVICMTKDGPAANPALVMAWQPTHQERDATAEYAGPISIPGSVGTALAFDFRHKRLARIVLEYEAPAGTVFDISVTEDTLSDGWPYLMKRQGLYMAVRHVAAGGKGRFETLRPYGLRQVQIHIHGHHDAVRLNEVAVINQVYPFEELGSFRSSDPLLNDIWALGWRSLRVCAEDSYTDTPFRERGLYAGDMLPQMAITLTNDTDLRLVRRSLDLFQDMYKDLFREQTAKHPDEIALLEDYPLLTLDALHWYFGRTADTAFVSDLYPAYDHLLRACLNRRDTTGLVPNDRVFIEWTGLEKREVTNTAYQAILYRSLKHIQYFAALLGRDTDITYFAREAEALAGAIHRHLRFPSRGIYTDGIKDGLRIENSYPISSVWPYLAGLTTPSQSEEILNHVSAQLQDIGSEPRKKLVTPYGSFYVLSALLEGGHTGAVENFIREQWSPMVYKRNDTAWENFDDVALGTLSHAWSGSPTYLLSAYTLGVKLGWPNPVPMDSILIEPQAETLDWAEGTVPHPAGLVHVRWELRGDLLWVEVDGPEGVPISVRPRGRLGEATLWVNGQRG